jgi:hypothetical protein
MQSREAVRVWAPDGLRDHLRQLPLYDADLYDSGFYYDNPFRNRPSEHSGRGWRGIVQDVHGATRGRGTNGEDLPSSSNDQLGTFLDPLDRRIREPLMSQVPLAVRPNVLGALVGVPT